MRVWGGGGGGAVTRQGGPGAQTLEDFEFLLFLVLQNAYFLTF